MPIFNGSPAGDLLVGGLLNDTINGVAGNDLLVGDLHRAVPGFPDIILEGQGGQGTDFAATAGASGVNHSSHNDRIDDGPGDDLVVGDAYAINYGDLLLNALAGTGGWFGGRAAAPTPSGPSMTSTSPARAAMCSSATSITWAESMRPS